MARTAEEKDRIEAVRKELVETTARFCAQHLDSEHAELAERLIAKLARKRDVPFLHGATPLWAAGVVYALAQLNFLFDRDKPVHTCPDDIAAFFGVRKESASGKSKAIRVLLKLRQWDPEFSDARTQAVNPYRGGWVSINGIVMPARWFVDEEEE